MATSGEALSASSISKRKVYVGNICYEARTAEVKDFFSNFGKVQNVQLLFERRNNRKRFRGFGFVTFCSEEAAQWAKNSTDEERTLQGRVMSVTELQRKPRKKIDGIERNGLEADSIESNSSDEGTDIDACYRLAMVERLSCTDDLSPYERLPPHILIKIFNYLDIRNRVKVELVCKRWQHAAMLSWQSLKHLSFAGTFKGFSFSDAKNLSVLTDAILKSILSKGCQNLKSLDVSSSSRLLTYKSSAVIGRCCPYLEHINLSGMKINNFGIQDLSSQCTKLKKVELRRCQDLGEKGFWWLFKHCPNIEYFDATENMRITGQCFYILNPSCHSIILEGCTNLQAKGIERLAEKCREVKVLNLNRCQQLSDASIRLITNNCRMIQRFLLCGDNSTRLWNPLSVSSNSLASIGNLIYLDELHLARNQGVSDDVIFTIVKKCLKLRVLNISGCFEHVTEAGIQCLSECVNLEVLNISSIDKVNDECIIQIGHKCKLKQLIMRSLEDISDESGRALAEHCRSLTSLDVCGCESITDDFVKSFVQSREEVSETGETVPCLKIIAGGTCVTKEVVDVAAEAGIHVSLLNLSTPHNRLTLDTCGRLFSSDEEDDDIFPVGPANHWNQQNNADQHDEANPHNNHNPDNLLNHENDWNAAPRSPPDHSHHLHDIAVENMDEWNMQRQMHYGNVHGGNDGDDYYDDEDWDEGEDDDDDGANAFYLPKDFVEDFLDADDPSMWDQFDLS